MGVECGNKKLFEGNLVSIAIDPGGHLPGAESAGVAAVAAAGQNAGPVLELDLVAVLKLELIGSGAFKGDSKIFCTLIGGEIFLFRVNSDQIASVVLLGFAAGVYSKLKIRGHHTQRNLLSGALDVDFAGERLIRTIVSGCAFASFIGLGSAHQLQPIKNGAVFAPSFFFA